MPGTGSFARGDAARSVPDTLAEPYAKMVAQQRANNERQAAALGRQWQDRLRPQLSQARSQTATVMPLADRMYRGSGDDMADLRRQQAEFKAVTRDISRDNAWMAVPALAPVAIVAGLEGAAYVASRLAPPVARYVPNVTPWKWPPLRGDTWATRTGQRVHAELKNRVAQKPGWDPEPRVPLDNGGIIRPDVRTPYRMRPNGTKPEAYYMELKPNTPTGRAAAARAMKRYSVDGTKTRAIYYDRTPKK